MTFKLNQSKSDVGAEVKEESIIKSWKITVKKTEISVRFSIFFEHKFIIELTL